MPTPTFVVYLDSPVSFYAIAASISDRIPAAIAQAGKIQLNGLKWVGANELCLYPFIEPPKSLVFYTLRLIQKIFMEWFEYPVVVHPHHTDYAGIAWHGTYIAWMEEARLACLQAVGSPFADMVSLGADLQVAELSLRYHLPLRLGSAAVIKTYMAPIRGVRYNWHYEIRSLESDALCVSGLVTLVPVDRQKGKIIRQVPEALQTLLDRLTQKFQG
ncbi:MAG: thioesterase family protein [Cyanobacteria bacterium J06639_16]